MSFLYLLYREKLSDPPTNESGREDFLSQILLETRGSDELILNVNVTL